MKRDRKTQCDKEDETEQVGETEPSGSVQRGKFCLGYYDRHEPKHTYVAVNKPALSKAVT